MNSGYEITMKAFLPVDPDDMEAMGKALSFIEGLYMNAPSPLVDLHDLTVETRFISRRRAQEPEAETATPDDDPDFDEVESPTGEQP